MFYRLSLHLAALFLALGYLLAPMPAQASVSLQRTDTGKKIPAAEARHALISTGVVLRLSAGENFSVYDAAFHATAPAVVLLSASSRYISAAVLGGEIVSGDASATTGQVLAWTFDSKEAKRYTFDIARFLASSSPAISAELRASLEPAIAEQQDQIFWGSLQSANINLQAPAVDTEKVRRDYMLNSSVIEIRRKADGDQAAMERLTAEQFIKALAKRDTATVRDLLDPTLFQSAAPDAATWVRLRAEFARKLTAGNLPQKMSQSKLRHNDKNQWSVVAGKQSYALELASSDNAFPFVRGLEAR